MSIPNFSKFLKSINIASLNYDVKHTAIPVLKETSELFTDKQYSFICQSIATMSISLLHQYHDWLAKELRL